MLLPQTVIPQMRKCPSPGAAALNSLIPALLLALCTALLSACAIQSPMVALGLERGIQADSHTRLRFPAHTPVLIRFDATAAPEAWAMAAHQGVAQHFPQAQRQQTQTHGLEWFVRWPYVKPEPVETVPAVPVARSAKPATSPLAGTPEAAENSNAMEPARWYSLNNAKRRLGQLKRQLPSPLFWRREVAVDVVQQPLPAPIRGLAQVVVSDRNNGKILALADVKIDQSVLVRAARERRGRISAVQRHANNERQITQAFAALAASLVASGDS